MRAPARLDGGRPLDLGDRALIERALPQAGRVPAEYRFANLFLFRARHDYRLFEGPAPHLCGTTYDGAVHALPLVPLDRRLAEKLAERDIDCIFPLSPGALAGRLDRRWTVSHNPADSDYWFDGPAMAAMAFSKQRRAQGRAFAEKHAPRLELWEPRHAPEAETILDGWLSDVGRAPSEADYAECREAIALAGALGLEGAIARTAGGEAVAFLLASAGADGARVIHFAKGRRAQAGAYPWLFASYCGAVGASAVNFEQDLGNPGLARSKLAFRPVEIRPKWRLVPPGRSMPLSI